MQIRMLLAGPILACLLASCASSPPVRTETVTVSQPVIVAVPKALTAPVAKPQLKGIDNYALTEYILALQAALDEANAKLVQIAALKQ